MQCCGCYDAQLQMSMDKMEKMICHDERSVFDWFCIWIFHHIRLSKNLVMYLLYGNDSVFELINAAYAGAYLSTAHLSG